MSNTICQYCNAKSKLVRGGEIYPHRQDLNNKFFYLCQPCDAYVGCHPNTRTPLGSLANAQLRAERNKAHATFDPLWRNRTMSRKSAYKWLAKEMGIDANDCHIGMFDIEQCRKVVIYAKRAR